ncbi:hypothetical protein METP2_03650 [Methanosarcinales archaeon]|nr:hypothetical protein METP2_03650 [Methanosarcinales archaeon]
MLQSIMKKTIILTFTASISYFIIYVLLKFFLQNEIFDWQSALLGAIMFGFIIFMVHNFVIWTKPIQ